MDEVRTGPDGRPLNRNEANIALCLRQGRIAANEVDAVRQALQKDYERIWLPPPVKHSPWED